MAAGKMPPREVPCPSCAGLMSIADQDLGRRVSCPHCRRHVFLEEAPAVAVDPGLADARRLLQDLIQQGAEQRAVIQRAGEKLRELEGRTAILRQWLEKPVGANDPERPAMLLQCRLFERLSVMDPASVEICHGADGKGPGWWLRDVFLAAGWQAECAQVPPGTAIPGRVVFEVAPGQVSLVAATVWMMLSKAGLSLVSRVDPSLADGQLRLVVPETLAELLAMPKPGHAREAETEGDAKNVTPIHAATGVSAAA